jgi:phage tail sheath gpL-like
MSVAFNRMPSNERVPFFYAEVNSGVNYYEGNSRLLLIGQMAGAAFTAVPKAGMHGNGVATFAVLPATILGTYKIVFTGATAFTVTDPNGNGLGAGATGTAFSNGLSVSIVVGGTAYQAGDEYDVTVTRVLPTAVANTPILIDHLPTDLFGVGSMLVDMVRLARLQNSQGEIWALPLADPAGVAATATITPTAPGTAGTLMLYGCGQLVEIGVLSTDTAAIIGANIAAAFNAGYVASDGTSMSFPFTAVANAGTGVVTCTATHAGTMGNYMSIDNNLVGDEGPFVANTTIVNFGSATLGTGIPLLNAGLAALGDKLFDWIAMPYSDATSLNSVRDFLSNVGGRWDPTVQLYGHCVTTVFGTLSAAAALGGTRNDPHMTIMPVANSPSPPWWWSAALGGVIQLHKNIGADIGDAGEISRPLQTLLLDGILPPKLASDQWDRGDRQTLYYDGLSGYTVGTDGQVYLDRVTTTYQVNSWGQVDTTWLDIETLAQTMYAVRFINQYITQKHPRDALVPTNPNALQGFTTPTDLKADIIHAYTQLVGGGIMKNLALFAQNVIVEQSDGDPNRVNCYLPLDVVNQLRVFAANATVFLNAAATS